MLNSTFTSNMDPILIKKKIKPKYNKNIFEFGQWTHNSLMVIIVRLIKCCVLAYENDIPGSEWPRLWLPENMQRAILFCRSLTYSQLDLSADTLYRMCCVCDLGRPITYLPQLSVNVIWIYLMLSQSWRMQEWC